MSQIIEKRLIEKATKLEIPISANFELTPVCNFDCNVCYVRTSKEHVDSLGGVTTLDKWVEIAENLKRLGCVFILLTGGEPLLFPYFSELYIQLNKMGFIITINTNASLIDDNIVSLFKKYPPRRVNITLYGFSEEVYEKFCHNRHGLKKSLYGISLLQSNNIDIKLNLDVTYSTLPDIDSVLEFADINNIPIAINSYMIPFSRKHCKSSPDFLCERIDAQIVSNYWLEYKKRIYKESFLEEMSSLVKNVSDTNISQGHIMDCRGGCSSLWISWDYMMAPCALMDSPQIDLRVYSVSDAWELVKCKTKKTPPVEACSGCKLYDFCPSCYASLKAEESFCGDISYACDIAKHNYKNVLSLFK